MGVLFIGASFGAAESRAQFRGFVGEALHGAGRTGGVGGWGGAFEALRFDFVVERYIRPVMSPVLRGEGASVGAELGLLLCIRVGKDDWCCT